MAIVFLALAGTAASAQTVNDQKLWLEGTGEAELSDAMKVDVSSSLRSGVNSGVDQFRVDGTLDYRVKEYLAFAGRYYVMFRDGDPRLDTRDETRHRFAGDVNLRVRPDRFELSYRLRLQYTTYQFDQDHVHIRNRFRAAYAVTKRAAPYVALEFVYLVSPNAEYRETRVYVGVDWRIKKRLEVGAFYMRQMETNVNRPEDNDILGLGATYTFLRNQKKDPQLSGIDPD